MERGKRCSALLTRYNLEQRIFFATTVLLIASGCTSPAAHSSASQSIIHSCRVFQRAHPAPRELTVSWTAVDGTYNIDLNADDKVVFSLKDRFPSKLLSDSEAVELDRALASASYVTYTVRRDGSGLLFVAVKGNDTGSHMSLIINQSGYRIARGV